MLKTLHNKTPSDSMLHDVVNLPSRKLRIGKEIVMKLPAAA
ncbi:hypothetical protein CCACVL1_03708 [Corchorus capsularis]|uniref:Uncharacterized protein n=1 Tax=Corchorus capsularis TaxID=210143 RepID=A0A1R3JXT5_COCAP|nr:hypothetical protein CCACVL1_03708 [Corchorus capsularis]